MAKSCVNHSGQPSVTMCFQCHKPICKSCTMVTPHGTFCSSECSVIHREFKEKLKQSGAIKRGGGAGKVVVLFILIAIAATILIHLAARGGVEAVKPFDVIGKYLLPRVEQR